MALGQKHSCGHTVKLNQSFGWNYFRHRRNHSTTLAVEVQGNHYLQYFKHIHISHFQEVAVLGSLQLEVEHWSTCIFQTFSVGWKICIIETWACLKISPNLKKPFLSCKQITRLKVFLLDWWIQHFFFFCLHIRHEGSLPHPQTKWIIGEVTHLIKLAQDSSSRVMNGELEAGGSKFP